MKKLFHSGYFAEIFRQLKVAGIVGAGVLMVNNISTLFSVWIYSNQEVHSIPGGPQLMLPMLAYIYVMGLVLTFSAFGWMNKRSSSDFYHAIPVTRKQMYFSSIAAILIWLFIGLTAYALVHALIYVLTGAPFNYLLYLCVFINMIIGCFEVVGAVAIACAVSGTRFVNLFAAVVILFMPRFLLTVLGEFTYMIDKSLVVGTISPLFDPSYNIVACPYGMFLTDLVIKVRYDNVLAMLYTLIYSIILIVLGCAAFRKRKSEMAGIPAERGLQAVVRTAIGIPLLLVLDLLVFMESDYPLNFPNFDGIVIPAVLLITFSFIFYSLYELIATKSAKKMAKAMPLFSICIAVGILYLVIPIIISKAENSVEINAQDIKSYTIHNETGGSIFDLFEPESFVDIESGDLKFDDENGKQLVAAAYNRDRKSTYGGGGLRVTINRKLGRSITRDLALSDGEDSLYDILYNDPRYRQSRVTFPDGVNYYYISGLSSSDAKKIAKCYIEEFNALSEEEREELIAYGGSFLGYSDTHTDLNVYGWKGTDNYVQSYLIGKNTPKTAALYYEILNERNSGRCLELLNGLKESMKTAQEGEWVQVDVDGDFKFSINSWELEVYDEYQPEQTDKTSAEVFPEVYELISILSEGKPTTELENSLRVNCSGTMYYDVLKGYDSGPVLMGFTPEKFARIAELYDLISEKYEGRFTFGYSYDYDYYY